MNGRNPVLIVIFFLIVGIIVFYMMFKVRDVDESYTGCRCELFRAAKHRENRGVNGSLE